jgi:hypothetical protein
VADLLSAYCWAIDTSNADDFAETFIPTGGMFTPRYVAEGRAALRRFALDARLAETGVQHWNANIRFTQTSPTEATADCYMFAVRIKPDPPQLELSGFYHDDLSYYEGKWRFAARRLTRPGYSP